MRTIVIIIIFLLPYDSFSQDTSLTLNNLKFNLKYVDKIDKDTLKINDLKTLTISDNSIITESSTIDLNDLESISFRVGNYGFWRGAKHGAVTGVFVTIAGIMAFGEKIDWGHEGDGILLFPMILAGGAILGSITGGIISMSNGRYLDYKLSGTTSDYKRKELKRLMEMYKRK